MVGGSLHNPPTVMRATLAVMLPLALLGAAAPAPSTQEAPGQVETICTQGIALGLTPMGSDGGWMATGIGTSASARQWPRFPWPTYNASGKGVHVAAGDLDGFAGPDEIVMGVQSGGNGWVAVLRSGTSSYTFHQWIQVPWEAYNTANGEVWPAVGNIDGDIQKEIVLGLGPGANGWFAIFDDLASGFAFIGWRQVDWVAYNGANGRTYPSIGNVDGAGSGEIILGLGSGSNGWIEIFHGADGGYAHRAWVRLPWESYNNANGEAHVAAGDFDGDGRAEFAAGLGAGGGGWLHIFDDANAGYATVAWRRLSWVEYANDPARGHTYPAAGDLDEDGRAELVLGLAPFPGVGGWFEVLEDGAGNNASLGWRNAGWPEFTAAGGGLFPAIGRVR